MDLARYTTGLGHLTIKKLKLFSNNIIPLTNNKK